MAGMDRARARRRRILARLAGGERAALQGLAAALGVSSMTIRRDLAALESEGLVLRVPGGCILRSALVAEASFPEKEGRQREAKAAIAAEAVRRLGRGMRIYLDTGTTCLHIARTLPPDLELQVFTNNLRVATELAGRTGIETIVYGGRLAARNPDLVGDYAVARLHEQRLDLAFTGADALDPASGTFYAADLATALLSATAQGQADRTVALIDSSKCGRRSVAVAGRLGAGMTLICDAGLAPADRRRLRRTGVELVIVGC